MEPDDFIAGSGVVPGWDPNRFFAGSGTFIHARATPVPEFSLQSDGSCFPIATANGFTSVAVDDMWKYIRGKIIDSLPDFAKEIAKEAITLDELAVHALADWVEEQVAGAGSRVRRLAFQDRDLVVVTCPQHVGHAQRQATADYLRDILKSRNVDVVVLNEGWDVNVVRAR